jgi:hypothetical protein
LKFVVTKEISSNSYLRRVLILLLISLALFLISYSYFQIHSVGFLPSEIKDNVLGNEDLFIEPKSFILILEEIHIAIFAYLITAVLILMVLAQIRRIEKYFYQISLFVMASIFIDTVSQPLILIWEHFVYLKSIFFVISNTSLFILAIFTILFLSGFIFKNEK